MSYGCCALNNRNWITCHADGNVIKMKKRELLVAKLPLLLSMSNLFVNRRFGRNQCSPVHDGLQVSKVVYDSLFCFGSN